MKTALRKRKVARSEGEMNWVRNYDNMWLIKPALFYFMIVFGIGFLLGPIRILWLVPRVGVRIAELLEMPLMIIVIVIAARWTNRRFAQINQPLARLSIGLIAVSHYELDMPKAISVELKIKFFKSPEEFRQWLEGNHTDSKELWVGFYKKDSGKPSMTWPESVDEALCFGWIDGVRKSLDGESYTIRFSPRNTRSIWSAINIGRAIELIEQGMMRPAGMRVFEERKENKIGVYSYEQRKAELPEKYEKRLKTNKKAWKYYQSQTERYRKTVNWWVISAKREETRMRRLEKMIEHAEKGQTIPEFRRVKK